MLRSLRSRLVIASVLWTVGLLLMMHMLSLMMMHVAPSVMRFHGTVPVLAGAALVIAGVAGLQRGLRPFRRLRESLTAVRTGENRRVAGQYASEVQPLIDDLNALLEDREKAVKRALATAGDLAHGLKTPLALLAQEADRAAAAGNSELAESIAQQVERMSRQVNYHLARARAAASGTSGSARCSVAPCVEALVRTLLKLHSNRPLGVKAELSPELSVRLQREDLDEILGNVLDNACKWAASKVVLAAVRSSSSMVLTIDDDGPGIDEALRSVVLERGVRIDQAGQGSGLGLAIVRDLVELYAGSVSLARSPLGGLRVRLILPAS